MTTEMEWRESRDAYVGVATNGTTVEVDGDEFAETLEAALKERADYGDWDAGSDDPTDLARRAIYDQTRAQLLNPDEWVDNIGINPTVREG